MKKLSDNQHPATGSLEDVFREQFAQAEAEPRVSLWDRIEQDLDSGQVQVYKKKTVLYQRLAAACAALLLMFGAYAFYHELSDKPAEEPVMQEQPVISEEKPVQEAVSELPASVTEKQTLAPAEGAAVGSISSERSSVTATEPQALANPAAVAEREQPSERQLESAPAETQNTAAEIKPEEKSAETENADKSIRSEVTVHRSAMSVVVDAPVKAAMGRTVTVKSVSCATGLFGTLWLQLENGQYLQPVENSTGRKLKEGNKYQIDYEILNAAGSPASANCNNALPEASPIKITHLKSL